MAGIWDQYEADRRKKREEEERQAEEERKREEEEAARKEAESQKHSARDGLSIWEQYAYDKLTGYQPGVPEADTGAEPTGEAPSSIIDRLEARGIQVDTTVRNGTGAQAKPAEPSRTLAALSENGKTGANLFTDRIGNTFTAAQAQRDKLAEQAEEERKNQTVRNQEWLDALRSPEEIQAELDEAKKEKRGNLWNEIVRRLTNAVNAGNVAVPTVEQNEARDKAADERVRTLTDELAQRQWADYERLRDNADFEEKSRYKSTANGKETVYNPAGGYDSVGFDDPLYEYVNGNEDAGRILAMEKEEAGRQNGLLGFLVPEDTYNYEQVSEMTEEERKLYNYIHETKGSQAAYEYLDYLRSDLYARQMEREKDEAAAYAAEHPILSTIGSIGVSPLRGAAYLGQAAQFLTEGEIDQNAPYNRIAALPAAERETVTRIVERNWGKAGSFAYGVGVSMAEFLLNSGISGGNEALSLALMGAGAASDATIEAKERGLADWQSFALGTIAGAAEIITEKVSIEKLFSDPGGRPWKYLLQNIFAEGSEEAASDVINLVADVLITQDKSEWMQSVRDYQKNNPGMSEDEAFVQVMKDQGLQILYDAAAGAASGGIMALPGSLRAFAQLSQDRSQRIEAGRQAIQAKRIQAQESGGGIVLPTADNTSETGDVIRTGAESDSTNPLRTVDEAEVDERVAKARNITEATGIRYGVDQKEIRRAERLGRMTGQEVEFYSHEAENGVVENGHMDPVTGKIWLNARGKNPLQVTLGHEFTHSLEGTDAYRELVDLAKTQTAEAGKDWAAKADRYARLYEAHGDRVSVEMLDQELTADFVGETLFTDERAIREMFRENPSLGKQVRDAIDNFIVRASDMGGIMSPVDEQKFKNVLKIYDRYVRAADREKTAQEARGGAQAGESVQTGSRQGEVQNVQETAAAVPETAEWTSWDNAGREISGKWDGIKSDWVTSSLEELYQEVAKVTGTTADGRIDLYKFDIRDFEQPVMKLAEDLVDSATVTEDNPDFAELREARAYLRKTPIYYDPDALRAEFGDRESYNRWLKSLFGSMRLTTDRSKGVPADVIFDEFADQFPGYVDLTVGNDVERLTQLADAAEDMKNRGGRKRESNPYELGRDEAVVGVAMDLIGELQNRMIGREPVREWNRKAEAKKPASRKSSAKKTAATETKTKAEDISAAVNLGEASGTAETADQIRARADELYESGEIDESQYDDMQALADELESTGQSLDRSTVERDEGPRGKLGEIVDRLRGKYSLTEADQKAQVESPEFMGWFGDWRNDPENASKVVNRDGTPKIVYHGTARGDRVGNVFLPERATSGPMAYFTDNEQIATNYARDKADTSLAYDEDYDGSYESQFRVQDGDRSIRLVDAWKRLKMRDRLAIREAVKHVTWDEDMENIVYDEDAQAGTGGLQDWRFRERNGNAIAALVDEWLNDGNLYGNEGDFMEAVRLAGIPEALERAGLGEAYYDDPNFRDEKVYGVYLNIRNPLVTTELDESFADALEEWWDEQDQDAYQREYNRADKWDKNRWDMYDWIDRLRSDIENGTTHVWTSIPDAVTDFLKSEGYDGIEDQGGKFHDERHTVYIPFESTQIKSATDNVGMFDPENPDIRYSISAEEDEAYMDAVESGDTVAAQRMVEAAAEYAMPNSRIRTPDGKLRRVYHGTNSGDFTVFDKSLIGKAREGDVGFFGSGFYFTFHQAEASVYGRRIIPAYLNIRNPFNFETELNSYNGERSYDYMGARALFAINWAEKFPELAGNHTVKVSERGADRAREISLGELAEVFKDVYDNQEFVVEKDPDEDNLWVVMSDRVNDSYTDAEGIKHPYSYYDYEQKVYGEKAAKSKVNQVLDYLNGGRFDYFHVPSSVDIVQESDLSNTLIQRGYDGVIQSEEGDEIVAFDNTQIKSADPVTYDDYGNVIPLSQRFNERSDDIRYSISEDENGVPFVQVEDTRIDTSDKNRLYSILRDIVKSRDFQHMVANGQNFGITNNQGVREWVRGKNSMELFRTDPQAYDDKQQSFQNADELLQASRDYINEETRDKKNVYSSMARGKINFRVGTNGYEADILVGIRPDQSAELYNVVDVKPKKITESSSAGASASNAALGSQEDSVNGIVSQDADFVNGGEERFSLSAEKRIGEGPEDDTDSWYFKNWFGDWQNDPENASKVVNQEDGTPKRMYHGTNADQDFHIFNTYGSNFGLYGGGAYFTDNPEVAQGYTKKGRGKNPRVYPVYLNIRNPMVMERQANIEEWVNAYPPLEGYVTPDGYNYRTGKSFTNHDMFKAMEENMRDEAYAIGTSEWEQVEEEIDILKSMGYDGINHIGGTHWGKGETEHDVWIAFDPEQIKSATDNIGTYDPNDPDIRYSLSEEQEEQNSQNELAGMSQKAKAAALRIERQFTNDVLQGIQRNLNPNSAEYRQFRADVARPVTEALLRGEEADPDAVLESTGIDILGQAAARGAVIDAIRKASGEIGRIRTAVQQANARQQAREARNAEIDARIPDTTEGLEELANRSKDAKKRLNSMRARTLMTDEDLDLAHKIATGQITTEEAFAQNALGMDDIINMADAEREYLEANAPWERYTKRLAQQRFETADKHLRNADRAKDKASGFQLARETPERNFRDVFGSDAPALIDTYIRSIHKAEAASTRFKNEYNKRVKDLNLSQKIRRGNANSEAAAVQFLGEAEDNVRVLELARSQNAVRDGKTLDEWRNEIQAFMNANPNLDYDKVHRGIEAFQQIYKELIGEMNRVLVENGYMPVNVRRGYFPHFNGGSDGVLATFASLLGINIDTNALPTAINGLTSMFKPGKPWFSHAMERTGFQTDYDALEGFAGYLGGVSDVIHQTPNIRNLRALGTRIRYMMGDEQIKRRIDEINADDSRSEQEKLAAITDLTDNGRYKLSRFVSWLDEYTNQLANKKSKYDRGIEDLMGRRVYTWMKNIEGRVAANMISGNLGSALTNFIPLNQAGAVLGDFFMLRGAFDTMTGRARGDGFVERSDFLTNRRGVDPLLQTTAQKISDALSKPMNIIDDFTSETIVRAAYGKYIRQGMDEQSAMQAADELAAGLMADRSKGATPTIFGSHNPLTKLFTQFQVEVNNEFSTIFKDIPKGAFKDDKDKRNAVAYTAMVLLRYFIGAYLFNDLYEKVVGRRAALDPVDLLNDAVGDLSGKKLNNVFDIISEGVIDEQQRANPSEAITNFGTNALEELPFVGGFLGGGRIPISSALPDAETIVKGLTNEKWSGAKKSETVLREIGKSVGTYILPPFAGGLGKKLFQTGENAIRGGRYVKDAEGNDQLQYPYFTDTPLETAGTVLQSTLFGPTATEGGKDWVEGGFGNQTAKNTELYKRLTQEMGEDQRASWDFISGLTGLDPLGKRVAVSESGLSDEGKAEAMSAVVSDSERYKFRAAYEAGVSADAWAGFYRTLPNYDEDGNGSYKQAEVTAALDNARIPLSAGEGAAQGLFGGDTETRSLTRAEKAAIWSAYNPKWKTANNPFDASIGDRVVSRIGQMQDEEEGE